MPKSATQVARIAGRELSITNPDKLLWPEEGITKADYIRYMVDLSPYLLSYCRDRLLTTIRFPDGIHGNSFYQKNTPEHAPPWVKRQTWREVDYTLLNDVPTLVWLCNQASLELHTSFDLLGNGFPTELVFDLDPSEPNFPQVMEVALRLKETLDGLGLFCVVKTSGSLGLQVYVPIEPRYSYDETREINHFIARYLANLLPHAITLERRVKDRGKKLYFDYLQHWQGKTIIAPYSPRARQEAPVSTPLFWEELRPGTRPEQFTLKTVPVLLKRRGDPLKGVTMTENRQALDDILSFVRRQS